MDSIFFSKAEEWAALNLGKSFLTRVEGESLTKEASPDVVSIAFLLISWLVCDIRGPNFFIRTSSS